MAYEIRFEPFEPRHMRPLYGHLEYFHATIPQCPYKTFRAQMRNRNRKRERFFVVYANEEIVGVIEVIKWNRVFYPHVLFFTESKRIRSLVGLKFFKETKDDYTIIVPRAEASGHLSLVKRGVLIKTGEETGFFPNGEDAIVFKNIREA